MVVCKVWMECLVSGVCLALVGCVCLCSGCVCVVVLCHVSGSDRKGMRCKAEQGVCVHMIEWVCVGV